MSGGADLSSLLLDRIADFLHQESDGPGIEAVLEAVLEFFDTKDIRGFLAVAEDDRVNAGFPPRWMPR